VFGDFDIVGIPFFPAKADSILVVDSQAVLTLAISSERFETIARRNAQIGEILGGIQCNQPAQGDIGQMSQAFHKAAFEQSLRVKIAERLNHDSIMVRYTLYVKRKAGNAA
jgi:nitrogenase subunit NifH